MKVFGSVILIIVLVSQCVLASNPEANPSTNNKMKIGFRLGYGVDNSDVSDLSGVSAGVSLSPTSKSNYQLGLLFMWSFSESLALRSGLTYSRRNVDQNVTTVSTTTRYELGSSTADIPLALQYSFADSDFSLFGGLIFAYSMSGDSSVGAFAFDVASTVTYLNFGINYDFAQLLGGKLGIGAEYQRGLSNTNSNPSPKITSNSSLVALAWTKAL